MSKKFGWEHEFDYPVASLKDEIAYALNGCWVTMVESGLCVEEMEYKEIMEICDKYQKIIDELVTKQEGGRL